MPSKPAGELQRGDVVTRFPYAGPEKLPVIVLTVLPARARGSVIVEGEDAAKNYVLVPCGHRSNLVDVKDWR